ncbi:hypothetical protein ACKKBF_B10475 [Auxenochlorella protothecoides x Auxenochlorella symbiontica]
MPGSGRVYVIGVDSTKASVDRLKKTLANFVNPGDHVHIAAVIPDPATEKTTEVGVAGSLGSGYTEPESGADKLKRRVKEVEDNFTTLYAPVLKETGIHYEVAVLLTPSKTKAIGEVLVSYAEKVHASAIVMGKSDRSALQELFIGSVAKVILKSATMPVIIIN